MGTIEIIVFRDSDGNAINIGEWDYFYYTDEKGKEAIAANPLPDGATSQIETVQINEDRSRTILI